MADNPDKRAEAKKAALDAFLKKYCPPTEVKSVKPRTSKDFREGSDATKVEPYTFKYFSGPVEEFVPVDYRARWEAFRAERGNSIRCGPWGESARAKDNRNFTGASLTDEGVKFTGIGTKPWLLRYDAITEVAQAVRENIWSHLAVSYANETFRLHGIPNDELPPFVTRLNERTKPYRDERDRLKQIEAEKERLRLEAERLERERRLREAYDIHKPEISAVLNAANTLFSGGRYVRFSDVDAWSDNAKAVVRYFDLLPVHLLTSAEEDVHNTIRRILADPTKESGPANERFIEAEKQKWSALFDSVEKQSLTASQRRVCVVGEKRQRIIAGAGTGKTSSMVAKIAYLICSELARPEEIFVLSYGVDASKELRARIAAAVDRIEDRFPKAKLMRAVKASTIHSMATATLRMAKERFAVTALADRKNSTAFCVQIQKFIEELARDPEIGNDVITYLANHSQAEKTPDSFESYEHYLDWVRHCKLMTFRGELMKSFAEVDIANFFTLNQIVYKYEHRYEFQGDDLAHGLYLPDFFLPEYNIYVEHFGTDRAGHTAPGIDNAEYLAGVEWKRKTHEANGTTLVETEQWMRSEGVLITTLSQKLRALGVNMMPISVEDALALANEQNLVTTLASLLCAVIPAFKESRLKLTDLAPARDDPDKIRTAMFFRIFRRVFVLYQAMLAERDEIDFPDMILHATDVLQGAPALPTIKYLLVDEFQDVSRGRGAFLKALVEATGASLCVVGDDWQAIYSFAGCDGALFTDFELFFGRSTTDVLVETFRFNDVILDVSSDFIQTNPNQIRKKLTTDRRRETDGPAVILFEKGAGAAPSAALEYLKEHLGAKGDVLFLGRTNFAVDELPLPELQERHKLKLRAMTAHGAKGAEADAVIVLRATEDGGFPSLKDTDPVLRVVLPPVDGFAYAEERRLFYVALTRARNHVIVCFDPHQPSMFVLELASRPDVVTVTLDGLPLMQGKVICRLCHHGTYVYRERARDKVPFYGCTNLNCREIAKPCPICNGIKDVDGQFWICTRMGCTYRVPQCPKCSRGELRLRKQGTLVGCSRYRADDVNSCRFLSEDVTVFWVKPDASPDSLCGLAGPRK